ncbi:hypothetical protein NQ318_015153 [Aromia moschata]|uniref:Uncharacterized protein n=1 Tax=Aromia moschata TaxID=1265417 RepID=A0AAV8X822_9CUCU|nr:hypothetical protein NQ318_015153 [Aromia moschata]
MECYNRFYPRSLELRRPNCGFLLYNATGSNMSASRGAVNSCVPRLPRLPVENEVMGLLYKKGFIIIWINTELNHISSKKKRNGNTSTVSEGLTGSPKRGRKILQTFDNYAHNQKRLSDKVDHLKDVIKELVDTNLISGDALSVLDKTKKTRTKETELVRVSRDQICLPPGGAVNSNKFIPLFLPDFVHVGSRARTKVSDTDRLQAAGYRYPVFRWPWFGQRGGDRDDCDAKQVPYLFSPLKVARLYLCITDCYT